MMFPEWFMLIMMLFFHVVDDYYLQGILANMKQRTWWEKNAPQKLYKHDYIVALIMHSLSWSFMIMLPIAIKFNFDLSFDFAIIFIANLIIHCVVDDLKANKRKINLIVDQLIHVVQIVATALYFVI